MKRSIYAAASFALVSLLAGCAFGTRHAKLTYEPASAKAPGKGIVAIAPFADARTPDIAVGSQVGQVRNGYGAPTANVAAEGNPVLWVSESLARALTAEGFEVKQVDRAGAAGGALVVTGAVDRVFVDMYFRMEASVHAQVSVERDGKTLFSTECAGEDSGFVWTASASEFETRLTGAMESFVATCMPKLAPYL